MDVPERDAPFTSEEQMYVLVVPAVSLAVVVLPPDGAMLTS